MNEQATQKILASSKGGKRARTKAKLMDAAAVVIAEKGFDRASLADIAIRAGMTRGAIYGNFRNKEELFLALVAESWQPIVPKVDPSMSLKQQMRILGQTVAEEARARRRLATAATAFQLYVLTHEEMQSHLRMQNAKIYRKLAASLRKMIPEKNLPMPAECFVRVLDALITGLLFTYFQTPELITEDVFVAAFEALA
ncbi:MAG: helix-turn-helix domain-containing protein [Candidatus Sulfotelmatobacter sp.]